MKACRKNLEKVCLALIEKGCDLNVQDKTGKNIFIVWILPFFIPIFKSLLRKIDEKSGIFKKMQFCRAESQKNMNFWEKKIAIFIKSTNFLFIYRRK